VPAGPLFERGFWVEPTIFTDVGNGMTIAREEIFGPVLAVIRCETTEEAIRIANDTEYGLSAGVWSTDNQRALDVAGQLEAGTVWVNDWHMVGAAYPFGGLSRADWAANSARTRWTSTPRRSSSTLTCPAS